MEQQNSFGTFKGVFLPSILTILGVILYLRLGWVVGNVGLFQTLMIVTISTLITLTTSLSIAATATNMKVGAGGAYYMISRSLGIETGAAVGIPLYLAQALGIAFYITGFTESLQAFVPWVPAPVLGSVTLVALSVLTYVSTNAALKTQMLIFGLILLSLASFFLGSSPVEGFQEPKSLAAPAGFWVVFAVFFPAVTGIEAGISLSGNLKNAARSLPWGTISAVLVGYAVYLIIPVLLYYRVPSDILRTDNMILSKVSLFEPLIYAGLWGAALSSALGSLMGAPRTLQALSRDRVLPKILGKGSGTDDNPQVATLVSCVIGLTAIWMGDLNAIASVLSMFFLTSYGLLNLAAGLETVIGNPSWRPTFRVPGVISLAGALGCLAVMVMIDPGATIIATLIGLMIYYGMRQRKLGKKWDDIREGIWASLARVSINRYSDQKQGMRSWRPNMLVFSGSFQKRWYMVELADAFSHGKGLVTFSLFLPEQSTLSKNYQEKEKTLREHLRRKKIPALVEVHPSANIQQSALHMVKYYGIGGIVPNTIMLGDTEEEEKFLQYSQWIKEVYLLKRNLIILREGNNNLQQKDSYHKSRIDVWWGRKKQNAGLMLALAFMLQASSEWKKSKITLRTIVNNDEEKKGAETHLQEFLINGRIPAEIDIIVKQKEDNVFQIIKESSTHTDILFLGMREPNDGETAEAYANYYKHLIAQTNGLPMTCLILAAEEKDFLDIFS